MVEVWSCGGGVQSVAIAALIVQGRLPTPDLSVIVDTERERSSTWDYYNTVLFPALTTVGVNLVRVPKSQFATVDLWGGADDDKLLIPAFRAGGKSPGWCSNEWKSRVVDRWLRAQGVKKSEACVWLGISTDEMRRVRAGACRYPLIHDVPMSRAQCLELISEMGWPVPQHSACWMCPNASNAEWRHLRDKHPEDWQKALEFEDSIRQVDPEVSLHKTGPLRDADIGGETRIEVGDQCAGSCWV